MYDALYGPIGELGAFLRAGIIASTIANVNRDPKKRAQAFTPADFMPKPKASREPTLLPAGKHLAAELRETFGKRVKDAGRS